MLKQVTKHSVLLAALLGVSAISFAADQSAPVDMSGHVPYLVDSSGYVVKSGAGLCWRTGSWTPAEAATAIAGKLPIGCECDKDLLPKDACETSTAAMKAAAMAKPVGAKITLNADTLFDFNKATLRPAGKAALDEMYAKVSQMKLEVLIAVGHADRFGSDAYNVKLSEKRAEAVKAYLVSKGIDKNRIYTEGKGKKNPVTKPDECKGAKSKKVVACLQPDRRVDVEAVGTK